MTAITDDVFRRPRRFLSRIRQTPSRVDSIDATLEVLSARNAELNAALDSRIGALDSRIAAIHKLIADSVENSASSAREYTEAASSASLVAARLHAEELSAQLLSHLDRDLATIRRESAVARRVAEAAAAPAPSSLVTATESPVASSPIDTALYVAIEDKFRGDPAVIAERQRVYVPLVEGLADADHPVLDLGCGRGEWLRVLADAGVQAIGVDSNSAFAAEVLEAGLTLTEGDLVQYVRSAASGSAGAITMFQVVEHLPFPVLLDVMAECVRVLRPGGVLIAETPNALNLRVAASTFWLDPTHQRPLHPEMLKFIAQQVGFAKVDEWFLNELGDAASDNDDPTVQRLVEMVDGPGDFALIAWT